MDMLEQNESGFKSYLYTGIQRTCKLTPAERFDVGQQLSCNPHEETVRELMKRYGICRSYIYKLRRLAENFPCPPDAVAHSWIRIDQNLRDRLIIALSTVCQASLEEIQRMLSIIFGDAPSIGTISGVVSGYTDKAYDVLQKVNLNHIRIALDEIFQDEQPVLTGVDLDTTYIFLMEATPNRKKDTWEIELELLKEEQKLCPKLSISDACGSILVAVPDVFKSTYVQVDVFHSLNDLGKEIDIVERQAEGSLDDLYSLEKRSSGRCPRMKTIEQYKQAKAQIDGCLERADTLSILFDWTKELVAYPGYTSEEVASLLNWILDEMEALAGDREKFHKAIRIFRDNIPRTLRSLDLMFNQMNEIAEKYHFDSTTFRKLYLLRRSRVNGCLYNKGWDSLYQLSGCSAEDFIAMSDLMTDLVNNTKRASSLVENLNSRVRKTMSAKRMVPEKYFNLLQLYFNTKHYRRSAVPERIGKSPMQLLTGKDDDFFDLLGIGPITLVQGIA